MILKKFTSFNFNATFALDSFMDISIYTFCAPFCTLAKYILRSQLLPAILIKRILFKLKILESIWLYRGSHSTLLAICYGRCAMFFTKFIFISPFRALSTPPEWIKTDEKKKKLWGYRVQKRRREIAKEIRNNKENNNIFILQSNVPSSFRKQFQHFTLIFSIFFTLPWFSFFFLPSFLYIFFSFSCAIRMLLPYISAFCKNSVFSFF